VCFSLSGDRKMLSEENQQKLRELSGDKKELWYFICLTVGYEDIPQWPSDLTPCFGLDLRPYFDNFPLSKDMAGLRYEAMIGEAWGHSAFTYLFDILFAEYPSIASRPPVTEIKWFRAMKRPFLAAGLRGALEQFLHMHRHRYASGKTYDECIYNYICWQASQEDSEEGTKQMFISLLNKAFWEAKRLYPLRDIDVQAFMNSGPFTPRTSFAHLTNPEIWQYIFLGFEALWISPRSSDRFLRLPSELEDHLSTPGFFVYYPPGHAFEKWTRPIMDLWRFVCERVGTLAVDGLWPLFREETRGMTLPDGDSTSSRFQTCIDVLVGIKGRQNLDPADIIRDLNEWLGTGIPSLTILRLLRAQGRQYTGWEMLRKLARVRFYRPFWANFNFDRGANYDKVLWEYMKHILFRENLRAHSLSIEKYCLEKLHVSMYSSDPHHPLGTSVWNSLLAVPARIMEVLDLKNMHVARFEQLDPAKIKALQFVFHGMELAGFREMEDENGADMPQFPRGVTAAGVASIAAKLLIGANSHQDQDQDQRRVASMMRIKKLRLTTFERSSEITTTLFLTVMGNSLCAFTRQGIWVYVSQQHPTTLRVMVPSKGQALFMAPGTGKVLPAGAMVTSGDVTCSLIEDKKASLASHLKSLTSDSTMPFSYMQDASDWVAFVNYPWLYLAELLGFQDHKWLVSLHSEVLAFYSGLKASDAKTRTLQASAFAMRVFSSTNLGAGHHDQTLPGTSDLSQSKMASGLPWLKDLIHDLLVVALAMPKTKALFTTVFYYRNFLQKDFASAVDQDLLKNPHELLAFLWSVHDIASRMGSVDPIRINSVCLS